MSEKKDAAPPPLPPPLRKVKVEGGFAYHLGRMVRAAKKKTKAKAKKK